MTPINKKSRHRKLSHVSDLDLLETLARTHFQNPTSESKIKIIEESEYFIATLARRFSYRKVEMKDLVQLGVMGMLRALDHYNPESGRFLSYAIPMIIGEIKHFFRDNNALIKVSRKIHERYAKIQSTIRKIEETTDASPTVKEISDYMNISEEQVLEGLEAANTFQPYSLDAHMYKYQNKSSNEEFLTLMDLFAVDNTDIEKSVLNHEGLRSSLAQLDKREKKIIYFTYYVNLSQSDIAKRMHMSQAHISRLRLLTLEKLARALNR